MGRNVKALKGLYVVLGGDVTDVADVITIDGMINAIADLIDTSGIEGTLPAVTATENGKIMKVVDGKWALAADATT